LSQSIFLEDFEDDFAVLFFCVEGRSEKQRDMGIKRKWQWTDTRLFFAYLLFHRLWLCCRILRTDGTKKTWAQKQKQANFSPATTSSESNKTLT
jgi:hypothetical protein